MKTKEETREAVMDVKMSGAQRISYKHPDGTPFKMKRYINDVWTEVKVGDIISIRRQQYKVISIEPNEVILELLFDIETVKP